MSVDVSDVSSVDTMPPPTPDWDLAKVLYSQGVSAAIISQQCAISKDALRKRIERHNWSQLRDGLRRSVAIELTKSELKPLTETSDTVRQRLSGALSKASEGLDTVRAPKGLKSRRELADTVKAIADPAKIVFGWEDKAASTTVNILNLASGSVVETPAMPVIDVQPEKPQVIDAPIVVP